MPGATTIGQEATEVIIKQQETTVPAVGEWFKEEFLKSLREFYNQFGFSKTLKRLKELDYTQE